MIKAEYQTISLMQSIQTHSLLKVSDLPRHTTKDCVLLADEYKVGVYQFFIFVQT